MFFKKDRFLLFLFKFIIKFFFSKVLKDLYLEYKTRFFVNNSLKSDVNASKSNEELC